jgi:hypothetical protein
MLVPLNVETISESGRQWMLRDWAGVFLDRQDSLFAEAQRENCRFPEEICMGLQIENT